MTGLHLKPIHRALCENEYRRLGYDTHLGKTVYMADITYKFKTFSIQIEFDEKNIADFQVLPIVRIIKFPEGISERMPHIEANSRLCFLDKESVFLDPFKPYETFSALLSQIAVTLKQIIDWDKDQVSKEYSFEFSAYWSGERVVFLTTDENKGVLYQYKRKKLDDSGVYTEYAYLPHDNEEHKSAWFKSIPYFDGDISDPDPAIFIESDNLPLIALDEAWPPSNFKEFFGWFKQVHPSKCGIFLKLIRHKFKSRKLHVICKFGGDHIVGITLLKKDLGIVAINSLLQRKAKDRVLIDSLSSTKLLEPIERFWVKDASQNFIQKRNNNRTFRDKKILVIGCGTIGGYLAHSLVQNGAGSGIGSLALYDDDIYFPENIGRHILGGGFLHQIKSHAMAHYLKNEFYSYRLNIISYLRFDPSLISKSLNYDLIIDATGESQFSTLLSKYWHQVDLKKPPILHGWIDASGGAVKSLLDDGKHACYHCLTMDKTPLEVKRRTIRSIRRSCAGSSFFEFTSYPSMTAAGLILDKALNFLHRERQFRFHHISLSKNVLNRKDGNPSKLKGCPCCQT